MRICNFAMERLLTRVYKNGITPYVSQRVWEKKNNIRDGYHYIEPARENLNRFQMEAILVETVNEVHLENYIPLLEEQLNNVSVEIQSVKPLIREKGIYEIIRLIDRPGIKERAAQWFHEKWNIPLEAYVESMEDCLTKRKRVPQWYVAMEGNRIVGGLGVIENDFHDRKDLTPNVCAVYVEEDKRCDGIAGALLNFVCEDMKRKGIDTLYLITDHTSFYERYGWEFLCMVQGDGEPDMTRMYIHKG